jgi:hypothetical protein
MIFEGDKSTPGARIVTPEELKNDGYYKGDKN